MANRKFLNLWIISGLTLGLGLIVALATGIGVWAGTSLASKQFNQQPSPTALRAATAARSNSLSMATGLIDGNVEGLYILDHLSGNLQCWLMNSRTGAIGGVYKANVASALASDKGGEPDYVMTTGSFNWTGGNVQNQQVGQSIVYVADANNGKVVGYSLSYNRTLIQRGEVQGGNLMPVCSGLARDIAIRDQ